MLSDRKRLSPVKVQIPHQIADTEELEDDADQGFINDKDMKASLIP